MTAGTSRNFRQAEKDPALLIYPVLVLSRISGILKTTLFTFPLCFSSENEPALAFHVKSMRAAQFIKLDGRALKGGNSKSAYPSRVRKTKMAMARGPAAALRHQWTTSSVSPPTYGGSPVSPGPFDLHDHLIRNHMLCKDCMKGDNDGVMFPGY